MAPSPGLFDNASSPSSDLLIPTLEFNNETAGVIRLAQSFNDVTATTELAETATFIETRLNNFHGYALTDYRLSVIHLVI